MQCRSGCGACCIAPSISSPIPGMPQGKPAGVRCVQLLDDLSCGIFNDPRRPKVCAGLQAMREMCGSGDAVVAREFALSYLQELERITAPTAV